MVRCPGAWRPLHHLARIPQQCSSGLAKGFESDNSMRQFGAAFQHLGTGRVRCHVRVIILINERHPTAFIFYRFEV